MNGLCLSDVQDIEVLPMYSRPFTFPAQGLIEGDRA